jgi:hypothetical protein
MGRFRTTTLQPDHVVHAACDGRLRKRQWLQPDIIDGDSEMNDGKLVQVQAAKVLRCKFFLVFSWSANRASCPWCQLASHHSGGVLPRAISISPKARVPRGSPIHVEIVSLESKQSVSAAMICSIVPFHYSICWNPTQPECSKTDKAVPDVLAGPDDLTNTLPTEKSKSVAWRKPFWCPQIGQGTKATLALDPVLDTFGPHIVSG